MQESRRELSCHCVGEWGRPKSSELHEAFGEIRNSSTVDTDMGLVVFRRAL